MVEFKIKKHEGKNIFGKFDTLDGIGNKEKADLFDGDHSFDLEHDKSDGNVIGGLKVVPVNSFVESQDLKKIRDLRIDQDEYVSRLWIPSSKDIARGSSFQ